MPYYSTKSPKNEKTYLIDPPKRAEIIDTWIMKNGQVVSCVTGEIIKNVASPGTRQPGLSMAHKSPLSSTMRLKRPRESNVQFWLGGSLIRAERTIPVEHRKGGGKRGRIAIMSRASRIRLQRRLAMTERDKLPVFLTLTYPDHFDPSPEVWKRDIAAFCKRLKRRGAGGVWRIEYKERKTGDNAGEVAPHFHLLVWGLEITWDIRYQISRAWFEVVGSNDEKHLKAGTRIERLRSWRGVASYVSKYVAKQDDNAVPEGCGRFWAFFGADNIPWAEMVRISATDKQVVQIFRLFRRYARLKPRSRTPTMCLYANASFWWDKLDKLFPDPDTWIIPKI